MSSSAKPCDIVFVPLAMNQTRSYLGVARVLEQQGRRCGFLCFHDGSVAAAGGAGFDVLSGFAGVDDEQEGVEGLTRAARAYGVSRPGIALCHEMTCYEVSAPGVLLRKLVRYLRASERALTEFGAGGATPPVVVQELGGFLSVQSVFYAARYLGLDNVFIEPSFFRGRVFVTCNTFDAPTVSEGRGPSGATLRAYLKDTREKARIVIPTKDQAHYRSPVRKILSGRNLRRLVEKTVDKHVLGRREEFDHIGGHVRRHFAAVNNATRLRPHYAELPDRPFVYYPLHVSADVALTLRSPEYLDQIALVEYLARIVPPTHLVALKEHPALRGGVGWRRLVDLLRRFANVRLLNPELNNFHVLQRADAVVTVNSKSGAEAILLNRPVVVLGDAFYRGSGLVEVAASARDLPRAIDRVLAQLPRDPEAIESYFQEVWDATYPGELHDDSPANCATLAASLQRALDGAPMTTAVRSG